MSIKVITDSTSDIPSDIAKQLDIKVVPIYVRFGDVIYRDGVDIGIDKFYQKLSTSIAHPATSQPNPEDFTRVYSELLNNNDGIISIHISSKISGTYNSAKLAKKTLGDLPNIEIIDSKFNSGGLGLVVTAAARLAQNGTSLDEITNETYKVINQVRMFAVFKTMKYLGRSGRINKTIATASRILNVMPLLTFNDGEIVRAGLVRKMTKGMERIYQFVKNNEPISELTIVHSQVKDQAKQMKRRLSEFIPEEKINITQLGAGLGVHGGPGVLLAAIRRSANN